MAKTKRHDNLKSTSHKSRAAKNGCTSHFTNEQWRALVRKYANRCLCCKKRFPMHLLTPDHIVPVTRFGRNDIDNIQPLCRSCNSAKNNLTVDYRELSCVIPGAITVKPLMFFRKKRPACAGAGRPKKPIGTTGKSMTFYGQKETIALLRQLCEETGQSKGDVICAALRNYADSQPSGPST